MVDLSSAQQSVLIQLYRANSVLYDNTLPGYKDHNCRNKALRSMQVAFLQMMGIRLEINDLKTKLQSFRTAVSREMTKVAKSTKHPSVSDDEYIPSYAHWHELQFLTKFIKKRDPRSNMEEEQAYSAAPGNSDIITIKEEADNSLVWVAQMNNIPIKPLDNQAPSSSPSPASQSPPSQLSTLSSCIDPGTSHQFQPQLLPSSASSPVTVAPSESETPQCQQPPIPHGSQSVCPEGQARLQPSSSSYVWSASKYRKRRDSPLQAVHQYKSVKLQADSTESEEDQYNIWAKNLVQDLKKVKNEKRRMVLQIQINRLVQDEILKEIEAE